MGTEKIEVKGAEYQLCKIGQSQAVVIGVGMCLNKFYTKRQRARGVVQENVGFYYSTTTINK